MTKEQFINAKIEIVKKVTPFLTDPDRYGPSSATAADCAMLLSGDKKAPMTTAQVKKIEQEALMKLGATLRSYGINCIADCLPSRRMKE